MDLTTAGPSWITMLREKEESIILASCTTRENSKEIVFMERAHSQAKITDLWVNTIIILKQKVC